MKIDQACRQLERFGNRELARFIETNVAVAADTQKLKVKSAIGLDPVVELRGVFGNDIPPITSTKSLTGHSLGAAGVQESIYSILMMQGRFIGESAHIETLDPEFEGMPIVRKRIDDARIDTVLSNSFGFGGTNATLVFQRYSA